MTATVHPDWIDVRGAAHQLGVDPRQVRRLAAAGLIGAHQVGRDWLIEADALRDRVAHAPRSGRPPSAATAWRILSVVGAGIHEGVERELVPRSWDRRVRHRVRKMILEGPHPAEWSSWLRRRGEVCRLWVHPGVRARLLEDPRIRQRDVASLVGLAQALPGHLYVAAPQLPGLIADYRAHYAADGDTVVVAIPQLPTDLEEDLDPGLTATAVVDLIGSRDSREHRAAERVISAAAERVADAA